MFDMENPVSESAESTNNEQYIMGGLIIMRIFDI